MTIPLRRHPDARGPAPLTVQAEALRRGAGLLTLRYRLTGDLADASLPPPAPRAFTDGLWQGTCLEAFVRAEGKEGYLELNFSPSTQWAAYRFERYREGMTRADELDAPAIEVLRGADGVELLAQVDLGPAAGMAGAPWRVGLSAVVKDAGGGVAYWALGHPPGRPDFHHPDCFALELPAPDRS